MELSFLETRIEAHHRIKLAFTQRINMITLLHDSRDADKMGI